LLSSTERPGRMEKDLVRRNPVKPNTQGLKGHERQIPLRYVDEI
jgi:hypothetical protein